MPKHELLNHFRRPGSLADGEAVVVDTRGCAGITVIAGAGATVTLSRVDSIDATAHDSTTITVAANTVATTPADWPLFRVSVAGGGCRYAVTSEYTSEHSA